MSKTIYLAGRVGGTKNAVLNDWSVKGFKFDATDVGSKELKYYGHIHPKEWWVSSENDMEENALFAKNLLLPALEKSHGLVAILDDALSYGTITEMLLMLEAGKPVLAVRRIHDVLAHATPGDGQSYPPEEYVNSFNEAYENNTSIADAFWLVTSVAVVKYPKLFTMKSARTVDDIRPSIESWLKETF